MKTSSTYFYDNLYLDRHKMYRDEYNVLKSKGGANVKEDVKEGLAGLLFTIAVSLEILAAVIWARM